MTKQSHGKLLTLHIFGYRLTQQHLLEPLYLLLVFPQQCIFRVLVDLGLVLNVLGSVSVAQGAVWGRGGEVGRGGEGGERGGRRGRRGEGEGEGREGKEEGKGGRGREGGRDGRDSYTSTQTHLSVSS